MEATKTTKVHLKLLDIFPEGASSRQLDKLRASWFEKYGNPFFSDTKWPSDVEVMDSMMSAIGMLSSCTTYHNPEYFWYEHGYMHDENYYEYYLEDYIKRGGIKEEFDKMLEIQKEHYKKAEVHSNVYTDYEGCSYNSLEEPDEVQVMEAENA